MEDCDAPFKSIGQQALPYLEIKAEEFAGDHGYGASQLPWNWQMEC